MALVVIVLMLVVLVRVVVVFEGHGVLLRLRSLLAFAAEGIRAK
jgi:hypothetical protein